MSKMSLLQLAYVTALRRTISNWRLETVLLLGIVLAVALMSSGVVFSDLLEEVALRRTLDRAALEETNFMVAAYNGLDDPSLILRQTSVYQDGLNIVERRVSAPFQSYLQDQGLLFQTASFFFKGHPQLEMAVDVRPRGTISYITGLFPNRAEIVEGRWPYSNGDDPIPLDEPLEVAIDTLGEELLQLGIGNEMEVFPAVGGMPLPSMKVRIVGLFRRVDPEDEFWYGASRTFSREEGQVAIVPLFTREDAILEYVGRAYPGLYTNTRWSFYLDRHGIRAGDVGDIQSTIRRVERDVRVDLENSSTVIKLDDVLDDYQEQILLARIPLFLMVSLTTGILIYYLALVSGLIVKSRSTETSMLKSRGATTSQIGILALVEGLLLAVPAVVLGPLLALGVSRALGRAFVDVDVSGELVPVSLSFQAFLLGAGGAALAVAVLTIATLVAAQQGIVEFRQSGARPPRAPFIHRRHLDILALVLIGLIWWQIQTRGSFLVRSLGTGELEVDYSLLLSPVLGLLALGLLVMRFFPLLVALVARGAESHGPVWLIQGLRRVSRDSIMPGALVVLLMLTTALGVIGSTFSSTLERSQRDRALYVAGADLRIQHSGRSTPLPLLGLAELAEQVDGVETAAEVQRTDGTLMISGFSATSMSILAVDSDSFADVSWYRNDFTSGKSLTRLAGIISPDASISISDGIRLPKDTTALALWVNPGTVEPLSSLVARLQDAQGYYFDVLVGELDFKGWQRLEAEVSPRPPQRRGFRGRSQIPAVMPPFTLLSLQVSTGSRSREAGAIFLEGLAAVTPEGEELLADFQSLDGWHVVEDYSAPGLYALESSEDVARAGSSRSAAFSWIPGGIGLARIRAGAPEIPIPAVVSKSLLDIADARLGDILTIRTITGSLPIRAVVRADYFPTLNTREGPFAVVDLKTFIHYINLHAQDLVGGSNELWVSLDSAGQSPVAVNEELDNLGIDVRETHIASEMVAQRVEQPFVTAGWGGLLVLMFLALVLASASGVMLFSYTDTRERHTEFALLRTLGFSRRQLNGVVWFNLFLVVVFGIGLGTWAGQQIGASLLPMLEVAEEGVRVTPPMVLRINWGILFVTYLVLAAVAVITVVWLAWLTAKLEVHRVLRIGEA